MDQADADGGRPALRGNRHKLMDCGVRHSFAVAAALDPTQPITEVRVAYADASPSTVMLYPADNMMTLLPKEGGAALTEQAFNVPDEHGRAPVKQGDVVGTVTLTIEGDVIDS